MVDEELRQILVHDDKVTSNRSDSSEDDDRLEMKWTNKQEDYIQELRRLSEEKSKL